MIDNKTTASPVHESTAHGSKSDRAPWVSPKLQRMNAGDAEVGPRVVRSDGPFSNS